MINLVEKSAALSLGGQPSGAGKEELFIATYGTTTFEEIAEAVNSGKYCVCNYSNTCYTLTFFASGAPFLLFGAPYAMSVSADAVPFV